MQITIISDNPEIVSKLSEYFSYNSGLYTTRTFKSVSSYLVSESYPFSDLFILDGNVVFDFYEVFLRADDKKSKIIAIVALDNLMSIEFCSRNSVNSIISQDNLNFRNISFALDEVTNNSFYYDYQVTKLVVRSLYRMRDSLSSDMNNLNNKEMTVLNYLIKGLTYLEIAEKMYVSINTVRYYTKSLYRKLDVSNRYQAAQKANFGQNE